MKDEKKTKKQLINELAELRKQNNELKASLARFMQLEEAPQISEYKYRSLFKIISDITEQKEATDWQLKTNQLLGTILDTTHVLIAFLDPEFDFIKVNQAYAKTDEREPSFSPGKNHFDLYPNAENEKIFRYVVETGESYFTEARAFEYEEHPERGVSYRDWHLIPVKNNSGTVKGLVLTIADVTERKQIKEELIIHCNRREELAEGRAAELSATNDELRREIIERKMAEEELRCRKREWETTFNAISDWITLIDTRTRKVLHTNRAGEDFTGMPLQDLVGRNICDLFHGGKRPFSDCPIQKMLRSRRRESVELQPVEDGRWLSIATNPVIDKEGNIINAVHIVRDISDRKRMEEKLEESEILYRDLFELAPIGISLAHYDGKVLSANKTMESIFGYYEGGLRKINIFETYENPDDRKLLVEAIKRYGRADNFHALLKRKDGTQFEALLNASLLSYPGKEDVVQTTCIDIPRTSIILCTWYSKHINEDKVKAMGISAFIMKPLTIHDMARVIRKVLDEN